MSPVLPLVLGLVFDDASGVLSRPYKDSHILSADMQELQDLDLGSDIKTLPKEWTIMQSINGI